ncbi:MAG: hypothetical protein ACJ76X_03610 [Solirubrobacteraceae bacterium]|jgi:uncharacterized membrane protein
MPRDCRSVLRAFLLANLALLALASVASARRTNAPSASTGSATSIASASATLNGAVNPRGLATTYHFQYGPSTSFGYTTASVSAGAGTSSINVSAPVTGLSAGTQYHFRLVASSSAGTSYGSDLNFTTTASSATTTTTTTTPTTTTTTATTTTTTASTTTTTSQTTSSAGGSGSVPEAHPQTGWVAPGSTPLSDAQAAGLVTHEPDRRPANAGANSYVPTDAQLQAFHSATRSDGSLADSANTLRKYVTGRPGLSNPSTDDLIQWTAHKWGIPEDWIRAQMVIESSWNQTAMGDRTTVSTSWYSLYPAQAQISGTSDVYQSMGVPQIRWAPDGSQSPGTEPLRWQSTAFALDYLGAQLRWYYDGDCSWCGTGYSSGQQWNSIGAWYEPYPWNNSGQAWYIQQVQSALASRTWASSTF